ncbi:GNAT family N-acetyltransferase [Tropicimonas sp. S265A]|uniref:GNAT family N-acetyltransferase n=1 Tax=Tropicimonas sp. S265A TaxID=3415134 RepID=UPI003C7A69AD
MATLVKIPTLETARLRLRAPQPSDADAYGAFLESPRSAGVGGPFKASDAFDRMTMTVGHWHLRGYGRWIIADKATDAPLGLAGPYMPESWPEPEIAWSLFEGAEGHGYAEEAAFASRKYVYDVLDWDTVISLIIPGNTRSEKLADRLGCYPDGMFDHAAFGPMTIWRHPAPEAV